MVVGASEGSGGVRAFVWTSAAGMQPLSGESGAIYSEAFSINNAGQVVGEIAGSMGTRAFLWTSQNGLVDLNESVSNLPGDVVLIGAFSINEKGQIVAFGLKSPNVSKHQEVSADSHVQCRAHAGFLADAAVGVLGYDPPMLGGHSSEQWVAQYASSHTHPVNRFCHSFGIPLIVLSLALGVISVFYDPLWMLAAGLFVSLAFAVHWPHLRREQP